MVILFISHSKQGKLYFQDPSARYRCLFPALSFADTSIQSFVNHVDEVSIESVNAADLVIFHRPNNSKRFQRVLNWAKHNNKRVIADFDDLLFAPEVSAESSAVVSGSISVDRAKHFSSEYLQALIQFDECIVSTKPLADWVKQVTHIQDVYVIPNQLPDSWFFLTNTVEMKSRFEQKVLRYLPGTSHHDGDFDFILSVLSHFLNAHPDVTLEVIGPLRFELEGVNSNQIRHLKAISFDKFATRMTSSWACIAPLLDTSFNQCKSGLKFWESGLYGIPLVASPLDDFRDYYCEGLIQARTKKQWIDGLESLLDWDYYQVASLAAKQSAKQVLHGSRLNQYLSLLSSSSYQTEQMKEASGDRKKKGLTETEFYRIQQQYFAAWFGPGWLALFLKAQGDVKASSMPSEVEDRAVQYQLIQSIWDGAHWASSLFGVYSNAKMENLPITLLELPNLPKSFSPYIQPGYNSWQEWIDDVRLANEALWQHHQPVGNAWIRKYRKFRRSPKHFFEDSKRPYLRFWARFLS